MKKLLLIIMAVFLFSTVEAGQPFAPKAKTERHRKAKKYRPSKKDAFVCTKNRKVNKKGLMR